MKYKQKQNPHAVKKRITRMSHSKGSACGYDNNNFVQKDDGFICSLCYEPVAPLEKIDGKFVKQAIIENNKKYLWVNLNDTFTRHRTQVQGEFGRNTYNYICNMSHFKKKTEIQFPVSDGVCEICNAIVIQIQHPVFYTKKVYINMKDSKPHFRRHRLKWVCIL